MSNKRNYKLLRKYIKIQDRRIPPFQSVLFPSSTYSILLFLLLFFSIISSCFLLIFPYESTPISFVFSPENFYIQRELVNCFCFLTPTLAAFLRATNSSRHSALETRPSNRPQNTRALQCCTLHTETEHPGRNEGA